MSIVVVIFYCLISFCLGWLLHKWANSNKNIKIGTPPTSINSRSSTFHTGYGNGNINGFGI